MAINEINTTTPLVGLKPAADIINNNFTNTDNAASKAVQSSITDFTDDRVMLTDGTGQAATLGNYMTVGGTANAITLTSQYAKPVTALVEGMQFRFKATAQNTGAVTFAVDGLAPVAGTTVTGVACPADYIRDDVETVITYNGAGFTVDRMVERGSNANGDWTKLADGTAKVVFYDTNSITTSTLLASPIYRTVGQSYDLPITFIAPPNVVTDTTTNSSSIVWSAFGSGGGATTTSVSNIFGLSTSSVTTTNISYTANGYWY